MNDLGDQLELLQSVFIDRLPVKMAAVTTIGQACGSQNLLQTNLNAF